jgi:hypothetical protein
VSEAPDAKPQLLPCAGCGMRVKQLPNGSWTHEDDKVMCYGYEQHGGSVARPRGVVPERPIAAVKSEPQVPAQPGAEAQLTQAMGLLADLFDAFDGKHIEALIGHYAKDNAPATIGGLASFTVAWDEQAAEMQHLLYKPWDELTKDEKIMRGTWSAQHAFVKRLGDLRRRYDELKG